MLAAQKNLRELADNATPADGQTNRHMRVDVPLEDLIALLDHVEKIEKGAAALRRELAEQYPVALMARSIVQYADDKSDPELLELAQTIENLAKQTEAAKLEYLPSRFRGTP